MCMTLEPSRMSSTILYAAETVFNDTLVHVMGYQNQAENLSKGPNAMLLPIPSSAPMGPGNAIDMRACKNVLKDYAVIVEANRPRTRGMSKGFGDVDSLGDVQVFDSGSYTVVLAKDASGIDSALGQVPANKRPASRPDIFAAYGKLYPGWHIALCCYDGAVEAEPMVWQYEPLDTSHLFAPGLDGHDGKIPNINASQVQRDHTVIVSMVNAPVTKFAMRVTDPLEHRYYGISGDTIPETHRYLFGKNFYGTKHTGSTLNGDFVFPIASMTGEFRVRSLSEYVVKPPGF